MVLFTEYSRMPITHMESSYQQYIHVLVFVEGSQKDTPKNYTAWTQNLQTVRFCTVHTNSLTYTHTHTHTYVHYVQQFSGSCPKFSQPMCSPLESGNLKFELNIKYKAYTKNLATVVQLNGHLLLPACPRHLISKCAGWAVLLIGQSQDTLRPF